MLILSEDDSSQLLVVDVHLIADIVDQKISCVSRDLSLNALFCLSDQCSLSRIEPTTDGCTYIAKTHCGIQAETARPYYSAWVDSAF